MITEDGNTKLFRKDAPIVNFFELSPEWQAEARSNLDEHAEDARYIEPRDSDTPGQHVLWDLSEAMVTSHNSPFTAVIGVSNNSAMGLMIDERGETCSMYWLY